jgi:radical SAM superfamily enzyme YgiQ (UPF0313 family)
VEEVLSGWVPVNKKVLFVVLPYGSSTDLAARHKLRSFVAHPYGVLSIATYLKRNTDTGVRVFDCNTLEDFADDLAHTLAEFDPDIIGISMMFDSSYRYVGPLSRVVRVVCPNAVLVIGGSAATASYETVLKENPEIEAVCYGEGELAFRDLVDCGVFRHVSWAVRDGMVPIRTYLTDLDEVIDIDYSFINPDDYPMQESFSPFATPKKTHHQFFIVTSRGCPFHCSFCVNSANPDKTMRYASVGAVIDHVERLVTSYGMDVLTFYDDQILYNKKRAKELFRRLARFNLRIECPNGLSVAFIDDELAGLMKAAGMDTVCLAIESGSERMLTEIIHKPLHAIQVKPVVDILRRHGFWIQGYFVNGIPGETDEDRALTTQAIKDWGLDWACISNACPTRGSVMQKECLEKGYIPREMKIDDLDMNNYIITAPGCEDLVKKSYLMNLDVNFINNYRMLHGDYETAIRAFMDVLARYPDHAIAYHCIALCAERMFQRKMDQNPEWKMYFEALREAK